MTGTEVSGPFTGGSVALVTDDDDGSVKAEGQLCNGAGEERKLPFPAALNAPSIRFLLSSGKPTNYVEI